MCQKSFTSENLSNLTKHHGSNEHKVKIKGSTENLARRNQWRTLVNDLVRMEPKAWMMTQKDDGDEAAECLVCQKSFTSENPTNLTKHHGSNEHKVNVKKGSVLSWTVPRQLGDTTAFDDFVPPPPQLPPHQPASGFEHDVSEAVRHFWSLSPLSFSRTEVPDPISFEEKKSFSVVSKPTLTLTPCRLSAAPVGGWRLQRPQSTR